MPTEKQTIAQRTLTLIRNEKAEELVVSLYQPEPDPLPGGDWQCKVEIGSQSQLVFGIDSFQAMLMAVQYISLELKKMKENGDQLRWLDMDELGFEPLFGLRSMG